MSRSDDERVADILEAANELDAVVSVGHEAFRASPLHSRAAERLLEIIGEASTSLSEDFKLRHGVGETETDERRPDGVVARLADAARQPTSVS